MGIMIVAICVFFTYRCIKPNFLKIGLVVYEKKAENDQCMTRDKNGEQQINCVSVTKPTIVYQFHVWILLHTRTVNMQYKY